MVFKKNELCDLGKMFKKYEDLVAIFGKNAQKSKKKYLKKFLKCFCRSGFLFLIFPKL